MMRPGDKRIYQSADAAVQLIEETRRRGQSVTVTREGDIQIRQQPKNAFLLWIKNTFRNGLRSSDREREEKIVKAVLMTKMKIDLASASTHAAGQISRFSAALEKSFSQGSLNDLLTEWTGIKNQIHHIAAQRDEAKSRRQMPSTAPAFGSFEKPTSSANTRTDAIRKELVHVYKLSPETADVLARDFHAALTELKLNFRELRGFRLLLLDRGLMPKNLSKRAELSAALAVLQLTKKPANAGTNLLNPDEAALASALKIIDRRLSYLQALRSQFPAELQFECVHQGATHFHTWEVPAEEFTSMNVDLQSQSSYPKTTDPNVLAAHPRLALLEKQFGQDFDRSKTEFQINGKVDKAMSEASAAMAAEIRSGAKDTTISAKNQWIDGFFRFFGDENAASVASHYLSQTTLGTLFTRWMQNGHTYIDHPGGLSADLNFRVNIVGQDEEKKCVIEAWSSKFGERTGCISDVQKDVGVSDQIMPGIPLVMPRGKQQSAPEPNQVDLIRLEFNLSEMLKQVFNPHIIDARFSRRIQLDWAKIEKALE